MALTGVLNIAMRGLQFFWVLLIMALVGNMIAQATGGNPSIVNYAMFTAVFGMLTLFYSIPATIKEAFAFHPMILIATDVLNTLFFFCGAVAFSAYLGAHSCHNGDYISSNYITAGTAPGNQTKRCQEAQASTAFMWFAFAAYAASAVLSGLSSRGGASVRSGPRRGGPSMSQV